MFGHVELFTEEMQKEYIAWCQTEEGKSYLKGGAYGNLSPYQPKAGEK